MATPTIIEQIISRLDRMTPEQQKLVLNYASGLGLPRGMPGDELIALMDRIQIDPADLAEMEKAIEEECERIDPDGWDLPA